MGNGVHVGGFRRRDDGIDGGDIEEATGPAIPNRNQRVRLKMEAADLDGAKAVNRRVQKGGWAG